MIPSTTDENLDKAPLEELAALSEKISQAIARRLRANAAPSPTVYGSRKPFPPPPGKSHRWLRENGRALEAFGAVRTGGERGRSVLWRIAACDWERYEASLQRAKAAPSPVQPTFDPERWIAESGHRLTRSESQNVTEPSRRVTERLIGDGRYVTRDAKSDVTTAQKLPTSLGSHRRTTSEQAPVVAPNNSTVFDTVSPTMGGTE